VGVTQPTEQALQEAQVPQRIPRLERIIIKTAPIENTRLTMNGKKILRQPLLPPSDNLRVLAEKTMTSDIKPKSFITNSPRDSADCARLLLQQRDAYS
jgi:hypothetical protein